MRALIMAGCGPLSRLRVGEIPMPSYGRPDLLIKVSAAGVNPVDWKECEGFLQGFYGRYPEQWIPGYDAAGVVEAVGSEVRNFRRGDRVIVFSDRRYAPVNTFRHGTFAEYLSIPATATVVLVPSGLDLVQVAAIPIAGLTAYQALFNIGKGNLRPGDAVLINGASGGVGSYAVQFAKKAGLHVAVTCSAHNIGYAREIGADLALDYAARNIAVAVRGWRPRGVQAIVDAYGGGSLPDALDALAPDGRLISIMTIVQDGDVAGDQARAAARGFLRIQSVMDQTHIGEELTQILDWLATDVFVSPPLLRYALADSPAALRKMKAGGFPGKIVLGMESSF